MERLTMYRIPIIATVGTLIIVAIVFLAWISPEGSKLASLHTKETQLQVQQQTLQVEIATLKREKANLGTTCASLTQDVSQIPGTPEVDSFLQQVTALAVSSGDPNTPSISVGEASSSAQGSSGVTPVTVDFTLAGNYSQMSSFLQGLYSFPRLFTISSITIAGGPVSNGGAIPAASTPNYNLSLTGNIYYSTSQENVCTTTAKGSVA